MIAATAEGKRKKAKGKEKRQDFSLEDGRGCDRVAFGLVRHIYSLTRLDETTGETGPTPRKQFQVTGFMVQANSTACLRARL
jgi:hypothetical protein